MTQEEIIKKYRIDELEECINMIEDEVADKINGGNYKSGKTYFDIVLYSLGKSLLTIREVLLLCKNGMPDGAMGLARNLFEQFIIISCFEAETDIGKKNHMVENYCADYEVQRLKNLKTMYEYAGDTSNALNCKDELAKLKKQYSVIKFDDYWWCGERTFFNLCNYVINNAPEEFKPMVRNLHISYKRACLELHANNLGNTNRLSGTFAGVDLSLKNEGQEYALDLAVKSMIMVVMVAYEVLKMDAKIINKQLNDLALYYQNMIQQKIN